MEVVSLPNQIMTSKPTQTVLPTHARASEKSARTEEARRKLLDGTIGAISLDTCIFSAAGYRLEAGLFKPLEQFKNSDMSLVFSEVTIREVIRHMSQQADDAKTALIAALRQVGKSWLVAPDEQSKILDNIVGSRLGKEVAKQRVLDFAARCKFELVRAKCNLDVEVLLKTYFQTKAPFENSGDKKAEFPDAIALLSLEGWSRENKTCVLFVTKDKGCQRFCQDSDSLFAIDELDDALALIQERQENLIREPLSQVQLALTQANESEILNDIRQGIEDKIWDINWIASGESAYQYDAEIQEVSVQDIYFPPAADIQAMRVIEFSKGMLMIQMPLTIEVEAKCDFSFSVKDGIDRDMVGIGDSYVTKRTWIEIEALLNFQIDGDTLPILVDVGLVNGLQEIDFGHIQPDYSDEDSDTEDF
jgi:hypothetical protein